MSERLNDAARLYAARDYQAAEAVCRAILQDDPRHFDALHLLGVLLTRQDRPDEAVPFLRHAETERPAHPMLLLNLGNALLAAKRFQEAVDASRGDDVAVLNNRGLGYRGLERDQDAEQAFRQAVGHRPDYAPGWFNLATTLARNNRLPEALLAARSALRVAPAGTPVQRLAEVVNEIARILMGLGRPEEALAECRALLTRFPDQPSVIWTTSLCLLLLGRYEEGWRAYEHRFGVADHGPRPDGASVIDPAGVAGRTVLILSEQGRGDVLQFIRYAAALKECGASVLVQAYPDIAGLLRAMPAIDAVVTTDDPRPRADFVTPVMSLPLAFGIRPATVPYLHVPADRQPSGLLLRTRPRVGVAWSGSAHSYQRSAMPASVLRPLLERPGYEFHCLQKDIPPADAAWLEAASPLVTPHAAELRDFADTAALIAQMDTVVTIDTAVAHLAGAMGKPVLIMLPFNPDWRWLLGRTDSPWYPTARLFRQPAPGAWEPVVRDVIAALG